jgi:uncharacterized protein YbaR (Trm112 family)
MPQHLADDVLAMLACPACRGMLRPTGASVLCHGCGRHYPFVDGIPVLLIERALPADPVRNEEEHGS